MVYCPNCGSQQPDDAVYCDRCGHKMSEPANRFDDRWWRYERRYERWERHHAPDYLDGVGFGVFLIAIAWVYLQYPWVWSEFVSWFQSWTNGPTMLPALLVQPIVLFFLIMGAWGLIEGGLRVVSGRFGRGIGNAVGGMFCFGIAYMVQLYGQGQLSGSSLLPGFIILIGAAIVVSAIVNTIVWSTSPRRD